MKKAISILLALIILISSSGLSINAHYCKGALKSINLLYTKNCSCGDRGMSSGCCKNKTEIVKIKDNYIQSQLVITPSIEISSFTLSYIQMFYSAITEKLTVASNLSYLYPPDHPVSLSILYRSILI